VTKLVYLNYHTVQEEFLTSRTTHSKTQRRSLADLHLLTFVGVSLLYFRKLTLSPSLSHAIIRYAPIDTDDLNKAYLDFLESVNETEVEIQPQLGFSIFFFQISMDKQTIILIK
jgi:hypothetical protein